MIGLELLHQCAPQVAPVTMAAIVQAESGGNPLVMWDNTTRRSYFPTSREQAIAILRTLMAAGHKVDVGIGQVDTENFRAYGLTPENAFDACTNLRAASRILVASWRQAQGNLTGALQAYNSGKPWGDGRYARVVYRQAGVIVPTIPGGRLAPWASRNVDAGTSPGDRKKEGAELTIAADARNQHLPPVRIQVEWTPQASPLTPQAGGLAPRSPEGQSITDANIRASVSE